MLTVVGLSSLMKFLNDFPPLLKKEADNIMGVGAQMVENQAQFLVPVRTGRLQRSIRTQHPEICVWHVGSNLFYSGFVEHGTSRMRAQPYLRPALDIVLPRLHESIINMITWRHESISTFGGGTQEVYRSLVSGRFIKKPK